MHVKGILLPSGLKNFATRFFCERMRMGNFFRKIGIALGGKSEIGAFFERIENEEIKTRSLTARNNYTSRFAGYG